MSLIIECAGAPGSGKTTYCMHLTEHLRSRNRVVYGRSDLRMWLRDRNFFQKALLFVSTLLLKTPLFLLYLGVLFANRIASRDAVHRFLRLCFFEVAMRQFVKKTRPDIMILDQWAVQDLWSATIFHKKNLKSLPLRLQRFFGKPDVLIFIAIAPEAATQRITIRTNGFSRFDNMENEDRLAALQQYGPYLHDLFNASACRNKLVLDAVKDPGANTDILLYHLDHWQYAPLLNTLKVVSRF